MRTARSRRRRLVANAPQIRPFVGSMASETTNRRESEQQHGRDDRPLQLG